MLIKHRGFLSLLPKAARSFSFPARADSAKRFYAGRLIPFFPEGKTFSAILR
jgi:hypothetical protein